MGSKASTDSSTSDLVSNNGEYWVLAQTYSETDLPKTMALLMQIIQELSD